MQQSHEVRSTGTKIARALIWVFLLFIAVITIFPVLYVVFGSFKENKELLVGGANIFPSAWVIQNYVDAWQQANFARYTMNSLYISLGVMVLSLINATMAGYVFSRRKSKFKSILYSIFIAFMFINVGSVSLRPLYELAFTDSLPRELDEAATIDGCTFFQTYWRIILPLLKPVLATVALLSFRGGWNEYIMPLVFTMTNDALRPLTVGVNMLKNAGDGTAAWNIMFAGATISIVPILIVYCCFSRFFMNGMTAGAVKG